MTSVVRYQNVENLLGVPFTAANFPFQTDGDDRQEKVVKRVLAGADISTAAGGIGHALGAIIGMIPVTSNVLWVEGSVYRQGTTLSNGSIPYSKINGVIFPVASPVTSITQVNVQFYLGLDGTIRAIDLSQGTTAALVATDLIVVRLMMGANVDPLDKMNP